MNGVLIIDKPAGMTSHDVVDRVRRLLGERSVGHLGTLDPMATGVLPLVTGRLTRLAQFYTQAEKAYEGTIRFGFATDTYDADGDPLGEAAAVSLTLEQVREAAARFRGEIEQMPPPFSAKKIAGVPAYKLARKKQAVELQPVTVEIKEFEILSLDGDRAAFRSRVASGTYLRSVAHDLGQALGTGAHLASLRRTSVAEFDLADAVTLEALAETAARLPQLSRPGREREDGNFDESALPFVHPRRILPAFPSVTVDEETAGKIRHGRAVNLSELSKARMVKVFEGQRELLCIAQRVAGTLFQPKVVLG